MSIIRSGRYYDHGVYVVSDIISGFQNSDIRNYMSKPNRNTDLEDGQRLIVPSIGDNDIIDVEVLET